MRIRSTPSAKTRRARAAQTTITAGGHMADLDAVVDEMTTQAAAPPPKKTKRYLKHEFSNEERLGLSAKLAQAVERGANLNQELDDIKATFKGKLSACETEIGVTSSSINKGYEMRETECLVEFHKPAVGIKTTTRLDTGEVVEVEKMDAHEMQEQLPLQTDEDAADQDAAEKAEAKIE